MYPRSLGVFLALGAITIGNAAPPDPSVFETTTWAEAPMLTNPTSISFDTEGRLYVAETERRAAVDVDIRSHKPWIMEDLANQSVDELRAFVRRKFAPENSEANRKWPKDLNQDGLHDWHDLKEITDTLRVLEDTDGDGTADKSTLFADGFNEEITGVAEGVLWHEGDVYYTIFPDLWKLRDADGDSIADERESMFRGFGVHAAFDGHDIHGLTVGPDGMLYFSVGDNGTSVMTKEGERLHYPNQGVILRCHYDGSGLEVFAYGLRNPQEIAFDDYGNLFTVDNDGDMRGERERVVYLVEGGDSGWRTNWQFRTEGWSKYTKQPTYNPWIDERMWVPQEPRQPAYITPPLANYSIGPGGFKYHPGIGLNDDYRNFFFLVQFPAEVVSAFRLEPKGASFEMADEHPFHEGLMISAVHFGNDGAFYMADWEGKWQPNDKGSIKKVDDPRKVGSSRRKELEKLLSSDLKGASREEWLGYLGYPDQRVRQRAQAHVVREKLAEPLMQIAESQEADQLARIHALWGLQQLRGEGVERFLERLPFQDSDSEIQAQCAKVAGNLKLQAAAPFLTEQLRHSSGRVRFFAAIALSKMQPVYSPAFEALVTMIEENNGEDAYLRHAGAMGLRAYDTTYGLLGHPSKEVRLAAVVALRRERESAVAAFLWDSESEIVEEAARAIHDDFSIPEALPMLAATPPTASEGLTRRILNANLRVGNEVAAQRLIDYALDSAMAPALRLEAALCLAHWNADPYLDRVTSRVRKLGKREPHGRRLLERHWPVLMASADPELLRGLTQLADRHALPVDLQLIEEIAMNESRSAGVRAQALELLHARDSAQITEALTNALASDQAALRITARRLAATVNAEVFFDHIVPSLERMTLPEQQALYEVLGQTEDRRAALVLREGLEAVLAGKASPELHLDIIEAAKKHDALKDSVATYESSLSSNDPLAAYRVALHGGSADRGRDLVHEHVSAQCLRCHNIDSEAHQLGPNLGGVGTRLNPEQLLESLVFPNAAIADGFEMVALKLKNRAEAIGGTVISEDDNRFVVAQVNGDQMTIDKASVVEEQRLSVSSMPPMVGVLTMPEVRDAVAYLQTLK
ncbi:HEAT repeat domain-containing protein [Verrucomicrobiales bacterium]|jgi:putative membrane-bound dehydrogenase-like protein|nr:HEAT repeat domain-containing protein [Verrucomicrobiales bacterium]MDF1785434.1 HEAT repeat domain-containing protein [Verrucomicrobiales bacterium]